MCRHASGEGDVPLGEASSVTLSPDVWGESWGTHDTLGSSYSPGRWADDTFFEGPDARYTE